MFFSIENGGRKYTLLLNCYWLLENRILFKQQRQPLAQREARARSTLYISCTESVYAIRQQTLQHVGERSDINTILFPYLFLLPLESVLFSCQISCLLVSLFPLKFTVASHHLEELLRF